MLPWWEVISRKKPVGRRDRIFCGYLRPDTRSSRRHAFVQKEKYRDDRLIVSRDTACNLGPDTAFISLNLIDDRRAPRIGGERLEEQTTARVIAAHPYRHALEQVCNRRRAWGGW